MNRNEARTPPMLAAGLCRRFRLDHDAFATSANTVCPTFWTEADDALKQDWTSKRIFANPPYGDELVPILEKLAETAKSQPELSRGAFGMLLPASILGSNRARSRAAVEAMRHVQWWCFAGRVQFIAPPGIKYSSNPTGSLWLFMPSHFEARREPGLQGLISHIDGGDA